MAEGTLDMEYEDLGSYFNLCETRILQPEEGYYSTWANRPITRNYMGQGGYMMATYKLKKLY